MIPRVSMNQIQKSWLSKGAPGAHGGLGAPGGLEALEGLEAPGGLGAPGGLEVPEARFYLIHLMFEWTGKSKFYVPQTRKYVDKYKNVVACYINVVDEYIFRLQSSISFYGV